MASLFDRTFERFRRALRLGGDDGEVLPAGFSPDLEDVSEIRALIDRSLSQTSAVAARATAAEIGQIYLALTEVGRTRFLTMLAEDYAVREADVAEAISRYQSASDASNREQARFDLQDTLRPPARDLLTLFNGLDIGTKFVVDLRADLRRIPERSSALRELDHHIARLLRNWFDIGFLEMRSIDWNTSAAILEKLIEYEAVHEIAGWRDLRNRLSEDRRMFGFFHPQMPDEPLIFVEVALLQGLADHLPTLLDPDAPLVDPLEADTAVFYSISNCQEGLARIPLGDFLIKRVVADLAEKLPHLDRFATLSPLPGFRDWLVAHAAESANPELDALRPILDEPEGVATAEQLEPHREELLRWCARYLLQAKRVDGRVEERVQHFHLTNGARLERVNWMANPTQTGIQRSFGIMVNYRYDLDYIDANHEAYANRREVVASPDVIGLL
ncbi:MAG: malonyl-CoA decarboxylase [Acidimicrobiia bacterium]|nr:malonyl-CoA decarboxylase [Acidimicrobiia bacterium]